MTIRPIPFTIGMARACWDGRKTQTRRPIKNQPIAGTGSFCPIGTDNRTGRPVFETRDTNGAPASLIPARERGTMEALHFARYAVGDMLWVREPWRAGYGADNYDETLGRPRTPKDLDFDHYAVEFLAHDEGELNGPEYPGMFLPQRASRMTLRVRRVWIERLQDLTFRNLEAEGVVNSDESIGLVDAWRRYKTLWEVINPGQKHLENPWLEAYEFDVIRENVLKVADGPKA